MGGRSCREFLKDVPVDPSGAVTSVLHKLDVLLCVCKTERVPSVPHIAEVAAVAAAACCALCAFTSPCRPEVLVAVRQICSMQRILEKALGRPNVLQRAEQMLPGACSALALTIIEAHLVHSGAQPGQLAAGGQPFLASDCAVLSGSGPLLGPLSESTWRIVFLMLPAVAAYTATLPNCRRPHALDKKCLLAALLKAAAGSGSQQLSSTAMRNTGLLSDVPDARLKPLLGPVVQLALDLQQLLQHQDLLQERHPDPATALANCLAVFSSPSEAFLRLVIRPATLGIQPVNADCSIRQLRQLLQLHCRILQRVAEVPLCAGSPWPMLFAASGRMVLCVSDFLHQITAEAGWREQHELPLVQQYLDTLRQLCSTKAELTAAQRMGLADGMLAISASVLGLVPPMDQQYLAAGRPNGIDELSKLRTFSNPSLLALAFLQHELLFLAAKENAQVISELLPTAFLAQRNGFAGCIYKNDEPKPTLRTLLAIVMQHSDNLSNVFCNAIRPCGRPHAGATRHAGAACCHCRLAAGSHASGCAGGIGSVHGAQLDSSAYYAA